MKRASQTLSCAAAMTLAFIAACAPKKPATETPKNEPRARSTVEQYLPLKDRTVSSFSLSTDLGDEGVVVLEIFRPRDDLAELHIAGRVQRLSVTPTRITQATGGTLLEAPLVKGQTFVGSFGTVTISEVEQLVETPAGTFTGCLTTVEESSDPPKRSTSTYCPGVGLVTMSVESFESDGAGVVTTRLVHHGPRTDIPQKRVD